MESRLSAGLGYQADSGAFTDLNRLNQYKVGEGRDSEENVRKVAQEFESLFLNEMLKSMRSANAVFAEGNFMNTNESKTYQDMHDQQLSVTLAKNEGLGLADMLTRQLSKTIAPQSRKNPFAQVTDTASAVQAVASANAINVTEQKGFKTDGAIDQSSLINKRRLALPGKLATRMAAGITLGVQEGVNAEGRLAKVDWTPAKTYAAPQDKALEVSSTDNSSKARFSSAQEFVAAMMPMAQEAAEKIGVDAKVLVAQAALETGWGKSIIKQSDGSSSYNLFGIKSHGAWQGESAKVTTTEFREGQAVKEKASFRSYDSYAQSFNDYVDFLQSNGRYQKALSLADNSEQFAHELQKAGYATDPQYARKINQIARKLQTYQTVASVDGATLRTRG